MRKGWEYKKLGEVLETTSGGTPSKSHKEYYEGGTIPWLRSGEVSKGDIYDAELYITEEGLKKSSAKLFPIDTVLIAMYGATVGQVGILKSTMCTNQAICGILPNKDFHPNFLKYVLLANKKNYLKQAIGGAQPNISQQVIKSTYIPIVKFSEQESVVSELDKINELIRLKKEQLKDFDNLAQSIFYEMFGDPVENEMGWEVSTYSKCFNIGSGGTPSKSVPEYWDNGNIPWIGSNMCQNCIITETDGKFITQEGLNNSSTKYLEVGTVLVALVGATIGKVALLRTPTCTNQNVAFIKANESKDFVPEYVFYNLMGQYEEFMKIGKGNFKMANQAFIKALPILSPPLPLQQLFAHRIEQIEHQKAEVQKAITDLETLLASRMQYWFE